MRHRVDYGLGVHPDYFGRGIGTKLLKFVLDDAKKSGFKRIEGEIAIKNKASWKMALKCGFKIEGIKKKAMLMDDGKYIDTYIVGKIL
jgi:RimJ/RimL family protein N-acetyltransferase